MQKIYLKRLILKMRKTSVINNIFLNNIVKQNHKIYTQNNIRNKQNIYLKERNGRKPLKK